MPRADTPLTDAVMKAVDEYKHPLGNNANREFIKAQVRSLELANRELIGLLAEARGAVLKRRIDAARGELWGAVKDCDDLLARIDARLKGSNHG